MTKEGGKKIHAGEFKRLTGVDKTRPPAAVQKED
jgi:hypothetical protein